jgi:hypothetical protein
MLKKQNEIIEKTKKEEKEKYNQLLLTQQHTKDKKIKDVENKLKKEKDNDLKKALDEKDNLLKVVIEEKEKFEKEREEQLQKIQEEILNKNQLEYEMKNFKYLKPLEYLQNEKEKEKLL